MPSIPRATSSRDAHRALSVGLTRRALLWAALPLAPFLGAAVYACGPSADAGPPIVEVHAESDGGTGLQALLDTLSGPARLRLAPGHYVLSPVDYTDPACGNCQDATETVPATRGLRLAGDSITLEGDPDDPDAVVLETRSGYGVLFDDCRNCGLRGITVTGGIRDPDGRATDAGVVVRGGPVLVEDCVIRDNLGDSAIVHGSTISGVMGVTVRERGDLTLRRCRILRNSWDGVSLYRMARATITDNLIDGVDAASGARHGGGRGVGIGVTWDGEAAISGNRVTHYWKGIGAFVDAHVVVRENVVEDILTWGMAYWGPDGGRPRGTFTDNAIFGTGACGVIVDRAVPAAAGTDPGELTGNVLVRTNQDERYDSGEPYCTQRPIARHAVPEGFEIRDNLIFEARQPGDAPMEPEVANRAALLQAAGRLVTRLETHPVLRESAFLAYMRGGS